MYWLLYLLFATSSQTFDTAIVNYADALRDERDDAEGEKGKSRQRRDYLKSSAILSRSAMVG